MVCKLLNINGLLSLFGIYINNICWWWSWGRERKRERERSDREGEREKVVHAAVWGEERKREIR